MRRAKAETRDELTDVPLWKVRINTDYVDIVDVVSVPTTTAVA